MIETRDRHLLEEILRRDEVWAGYMLGDLDDAQFDRTRWFLSDPDGAALALLYQLGHTTLLTYGASGATLSSLVTSLPLPESFHIHYPATHSETLDPLLEGVRHAHTRLAVRPEDLRAVPAPDGAQARALTPDDVPSVENLYTWYPENWFEPSRVADGTYVGIEVEGKLVAVGGAHVRSKRTRVAALGDILTEPSRRGRGIGAFLTYTLCERLFADVDLIVLNVKSTNEAAKRAYAKVGFGSPIPHLEGTQVALSSRRFS